MSTARPTDPTISQLVHPIPFKHQEDPLRSKLPIPLTPLVGREREVRAVSTLLRSGDVRLVVLVGPGGVGKTRLALQLAAEMQTTFADGVWFVSLAAVTDLVNVIPAIARSLGLWEGQQRPILERLEALLENQDVLLILDNFEQVAAAAPEVTGLLAACPRLMILVTSRIVLHVAGEHNVAVSPLTLPAVPKASRGDPQDALLASEAARLFVARAKAAYADFALTPGNAMDIAAICHRLDGLPLAIELAAARVTHLPPHALIARLEHRLPLLTGGSRDAPARLRTMRDAIAWSYDLLAPTEQQLFRRLSVFVGGFTLGAAEAVAGNGGGEVSERAEAPIEFSSAPPTNWEVRTSVLDGIASLVDQSLLRQAGERGEEPGYVMLETIREFGLERLEASGEADEMRQRHAAWCLDLALAAAAGFAGRGAATWGDRLEAEHSNIRAALELLAARGDVAALLSLAHALDPLWWYLGHSREGLQWLRWGLARSDGVPTSLVVQTTLAAARLAAERCEHTAAAKLAAETVDRARAIGDSAALAGALSLLAQIIQLAGDAVAARTRYEEALTVYHEVNDQAGVTMIRSHMAMLGDLGGVDRAGNPADLALARTRWEEELQFFQEHGSAVQVARAVHGLAYVAYKERDYPRATNLAHQALRLRWALRDIRAIPALFEDLGDIAGMTGQPVVATRLYGAAEVLREIVDNPIPPWFQPEYEREVAVARQALPAEVFAADWAAGRALPLEQAVSEALAVSVPATTDLPTLRDGAATAPSLTPREREVLQLLVEGNSNPEIATALSISRRTAAHHVESILTKMGVESRTAAVSYALRNGLA